MRAGRVRGLLFVVSGPSGGGKTTVVRELLRKTHRLARSVSVTTRPARRGERRARAYRFISDEQFESLRKSGELLEWANVHGANYGTPRAPVLLALKRQCDVVLSIDVQGARQLRARLGDRVLLIFLMPPSMSILRRRLVRRHTDNRKEISRRLAAARKEISSAAWYDYVVVNDRVHKAVSKIQAIITAQHCRRA